MKAAKELHEVTEGGSVKFTQKRLLCGEGTAEVGGGEVAIDAIAGT